MSKACEEDEIKRCREYDAIYGPPGQDHHNLGKYAGFPVFSYRLRSTEWPDKFKPSGIERYDGKRYPVQWLCNYATAIKATKGSTDTMCTYFPVSLAPSPLT